MNDASEFSPIEVTTHNIYFHEDSPILSADSNGSLIATSGYDKVIRLWKATTRSMHYRQNIYKTAANSSVSIEHYRDLSGFSNPINCVRFGASKEHEFVIAGCSDGGKVMLFAPGAVHTVRGADGDDAYEVCWVGCNQLAVGFISGRIEVHQIEIYEIEQEDSAILNASGTNPSNEVTNIPPEENANKINNIFAEDKENKSNIPSNVEEKNASANDSNSKETSTQKELKNIKISSKLLCSQKLHGNSIQGISFNAKYNFLATHSLDKTVKIHKAAWNENKEMNMESINCFEKQIDYSRGLFKRLLFDEELLYAITKQNTLKIYAAPFTEHNMFASVGPLNASIVKILKLNSLLVICTKKAVYLIEEKKGSDKHYSFVVCIDSACFLPITDAFIYDGILFVSSMDGFLTSVRLTFKDSKES
ncbi:hypothetical protein ENBRE01_0118 [Enteropsectra breve]|nr:hypothetical protein ENBRE01_0118 [Enteropsectra breve]